MYLSINQHFPRCSCRFLTKFVHLYWDKTYKWAYARLIMTWSRCHNSCVRIIAEDISNVAGVVCLVIAARLTAYACLQGSAISTPLVNQRTNGHGLWRGVIKPIYGVIKRGYVRILQRATIYWSNIYCESKTTYTTRAKIPGFLQRELLLWIALTSFLWEKARKLVGAKEWQRGL